MTGCWRIASHSSWSSGPGFWSTASETAPGFGKSLKVDDLVPADGSRYIREEVDDGQAAVVELDSARGAQVGQEHPAQKRAQRAAVADDQHPGVRMAGGDRFDGADDP